MIFRYPVERDVGRVVAWSTMPGEKGQLALLPNSPLCASAGERCDPGPVQEARN